MEDFTATRPTAVIVLDLESEADVLARINGRRVDLTTGNKYGFDFHSCMYIRPAVFFFCAPWRLLSHPRLVSSFPVSKGILLGHWLVKSAQ